MARIDHVICPVDLSPASARALQYAVAWARSHDAALQVIHVAPLPQMLVATTGQSFVLPERPLGEIRAEVERFVASVVADDILPVVETLQGDAVAAILDASARELRSLLVMGTHGWTGLDRVLLGSVTERVAHSLSCPLLVVPPHPTAGAGADIAPTRILCAVDFRPSSLAGLRYALTLAKQRKTRLDLVTVVETPHHGGSLVWGRWRTVEEERAQRITLLQALHDHVPDAARQSCQVHEDVLTGHPAESLLSYARDVKAQLVVVGTGDRVHLHALWLGSTTGRLMRSSACPVLIVPGPEQPRQAFVVSNVTESTAIGAQP